MDSATRASKHGRHKTSYERDVELFDAARAGDVATCSRLLRDGVPPDPVDGEWEDGVALAAAAANGHIEVCKLLLNAGADANWGKEAGTWTALAAAASSDTDVAASIAALLLERGAHPDPIRTGLYDAELTPIMDAVRSKNYELTALLLKHQVNVHAVDDEEGSLLAMAAGNDDLRMVALLLEHGADPDESDADGTPLLVAAVKDGNVPLCRELLRHRVNVDAVDECVCTALMHAAGSGHESAQELCSMLLASGASVEARDLDDHAPLCHAAHGADAACVRLLVRAGADLNARHSNKRTPLACGIMRGAPVERCVALIEAGAALAGSCKCEHELLVRIAEDPSYAPIMRMALAVGMNPNVLPCDDAICCDEDEAPLISAARYGCTEACMMLLDHGADPAVDDGGQTPLLAAAECGLLPVCDRLLRLGVNPNHEDAYHQTALYLAAKSDHAGVCARLLKHGARVEASLRRDAPLLAAAELGYSDVCSVLLAHGASVNAPGFAGGLPPFAACVSHWSHETGYFSPPRRRPTYRDFEFDSYAATIAVLLLSRAVDFRIPSNAQALHLFTRTQALRPVAAVAAWRLRAGLLIARHCRQTATRTEAAQPHNLNEHAADRPQASTRRASSRRRVATRR